MSREMYLTRVLKEIFKDFEGSANGLSYSDRESLWYQGYNDRYEEIMSELERL